MRFVRNSRGKEQLVIEDAVLRFHNFEGRQTDFNAKGNRNIDVILPDNEIAVAMGEKGWNVKIRKPQDPEDDPYYTLNIKINLESRWPPRIFQHNKKGTIELTSIDYWIEAIRSKYKTAEELTRDFPTRHELEQEALKYMYDAISNLDSLALDDIGIVINGSEWENERFGHGIKAYLDELHFRPQPSLFGNRYDEEAVETEDIPF